jgi:hypothetical protein
MTSPFHVFYNFIHDTTTWKLIFWSYVDVATLFYQENMRSFNSNYLS